MECDENVPCSACVKHGIKCSLLTPGNRQTLPLAAATGGTARGSSVSSSAESRSNASAEENDAATPPTSSTTTTANTTITTSEAEAAADPFVYFNHLTIKQQHRETDTQWISDLALMHHFSTVTWETLPESHRRQKIWQLALPKLAGGYDFLMHQLLALAASHLAFLSPEKHNPHSMQATQHQSEAIQGLRGVIPHVNESNCHAVFATTSLLPISAYAAQAEHIAKGEAGPGINDLLEVFTLMRGMTSILRRWEDTIFAGPLGPLLWQTPDKVRETPFLTNLVECLEDFGTSDEVTELVPELRKLFRDEIRTLIGCVGYATESSLEPELRVATMWPIFFTDGFIALLRQRQPAAMKVLGFYLRVLDAVGDANWYMRGWGRCISENLEKEP